MTDLASQAAAQVALHDVDKVTRRHGLDLVPAADLEAFDQGYALLNEQFGPTGEIERYETLRDWFLAGSLSPPGAPIPAWYHMILARGPDGALAGVRDCFVTVDAVAGRAVVLLSHSYVAPPFRRGGLAALLRGVPVVLARQALERAGRPDGEILLAAEMEMVTPRDRDSVIRLVAYGRAGFQVIPPQALPYAQPDFRDLAHLGLAAEPLPFLCLVRQVGQEGLTTISHARARAFVEHIQAVHRCHTDPAQLELIRAHALGALERDPRDPLPLIQPPADIAQVERLQPLLRSVVFPLYPAAWRGREPLAEPSAELSGLVAAWTREPSP